MGERKMTEPERIAEEYNDARRLAGFVGNGQPLWGYDNGWYKIGWGRYRKSQVIKMTANLLARAGKQDSDG